MCPQLPLLTPGVPFPVSRYVERRHKTYRHCYYLEPSTALHIAKNPLPPDLNASPLTQQRSLERFIAAPKPCLRPTSVSTMVCRQRANADASRTSTRSWGSKTTKPHPRSRWAWDRTKRRPSCGHAMAAEAAEAAEATAGTCRGVAAVAERSDLLAFISYRALLPKSSAGRGTEMCCRGTEMRGASTSEVIVGSGARRCHRSWDSR
jgi:hypothetical protein